MAITVAQKTDPVAVQRVLPYRLRSDKMMVLYIHSKIYEIFVFMLEHFSSFLSGFSFNKFFFSLKK